ncbi:Na(+)-translocating NADH-quinone reductase subunit A [Chryseotalea sanaruensis]|uniref:Na(+)-translocating NADH-quinone reductase subunit A n=1 Tax=Chryseotalea sanaruensis TaxID=2482724 RepID=A0A401UF50_9BACT|nr:Na(+)-translocating NADH-quinone reductase subunit A [Chryseotalea sanaruensis]GCC53535.1 Na(+)-translocating NADH-quinone reductase subunit A [Chryseotalea sanaruensis]
MGKFIRLKKGFDINLAGKAALKLSNIEQAETFVIKPDDFHGIYMPKVMVKEGDTVKAGSPLFHDKKNEKIVFTAPVSGEVVEVKRGEKRKLIEIKILADKTVESLSFNKYSVSDLTSLAKDKIQEQLLSSGVWVNLVQRPYGVVANPEETPKSIFISGFDSHPLAPDYNFIYKGQEQFFQAGIDVLKKLTTGAVHVNVHSEREISPVFSQVKNAELNKFSGPHPSGCVGVQIHHIDPINKGDVVWTINPAGVIQIGKLFLNGIVDSAKIVAVAGSEVSEPQYYKTYTGASVKKFLNNNLKNEHVRVISGNVLTGTSIGKDGHMGFFDQMITAIPEGDQYEFLGWITPSANKVSFHRAWGLFSFLSRAKEAVVDSNTHGEPRAFVQSGVFEKVVPMDILPTHLLKAIIAEDYDDMEALGIYEVIEEDLALCEFVDVSKHNVQSIVREGIDLLANA